MPRPQFRLRSLFILTAIVAVACVVGPPTWTRFRRAFFQPIPQFPIVTRGKGPSGVIWTRRQISFHIDGVDEPATDE